MRSDYSGVNWITILLVLFLLLPIQKEKLKAWEAASLDFEDFDFYNLENVCDQMSIMCTARHPLFSFIMKFRV